MTEMPAHVRAYQKATGKTAVIYDKPRWKGDNRWFEAAPERPYPITPVPRADSPELLTALLEGMLAKMYGVAILPAPPQSMFSVIIWQVTVIPTGQIITYGPTPCAALVAAINAMEDADARS